MVSQNGLRPTSSQNETLSDDEVRKALSIYKNYFDLFHHVSWIDERNENIVYLSEGTWKIEATVDINLMRVKELVGDGLANKTCRLPIIELDKRTRGTFFEARLADGTNAKIEPDEYCYAVELMIILGAVVHTIEHWDETPVDTIIDMLPSGELCNCMLTEIRRYIPPEEQPQKFISNFKSGLEEALLREYNELEYNYPDFSLLFVHFVYNWIPLLRINLESQTENYEVISLRYCEIAHQDYAIKTKEKLKDRCNAFFHGREFMYLLKRIGTSESETFTIHAPEWTVFQPVTTSAEDPIPCFLAEYKTKSGDFGDEPAFNADAILSEDKVTIHTHSVWDQNQKGPRRRFDLAARNVSQTAELQSNGYKNSVLTAYFPYELNVGWRAKPMRLGKAYLTFLLVSTISILFILIKILVNDLGCFGLLGPYTRFPFWRTFTLLPTLSMVIPMLALVFSNLQEEIPFYRRILMKPTIKLVYVGIAVDIVSFLCGMMSESRNDIVDTIAFWVVLFAFVVALVGFFFMFRWYSLNRTHGGKNNKWYEDRDGPITGKLEIKPVFVDETL